MPLQLGHGRGRVVEAATRQLRQEPQHLAARPGGERRDIGVSEPQRLEQPHRQAGEARLRDSDLQPLRPEALLIPEAQGGEPVQGDGGLAAARAAEHQERLGLVGVDDLKLDPVEERRDVGRLEPARPADAQPELATLRGPRPAGQRRQGLGVQGDPRGRAGRLLQDDVRRVHGAQLALGDDHDAAHLHHTLGVAAGQLFFVSVALAVAVEELRERRVAPIDDAQPGGAVEEGGVAEQVVARLVSLPQAQVGEVGAGPVRERPETASLADRARDVELVEQGRQVVGAGAGGLVAQLAKPLGRGVPPLPAPCQLGEPPLHAAQQLLLLGEDAPLGFSEVLRWPAHPVTYNGQRFGAKPEASVDALGHGIVCPVVTGERLGRYTLLGKLATGGMAEVFLARQDGPQGFAKTVVIKQILPHLTDDAQFVQMFLNEARLAALINHPNVVSIYELGKIPRAAPITW